MCLFQTFFIDRFLDSLTSPLQPQEFHRFEEDNTVVLSGEYVRICYLGPYSD